MRVLGCVILTSMQGVGLCDRGSCLSKFEAYRAGRQEGEITSQPGLHRHWRKLVTHGHPSWGIVKGGLKPMNRSCLESLPRGRPQSRL